jgi:hypothetical protein
MMDPDQGQVPQVGDQDPDDADRKVQVCREVSDRCGQAA